MRLADIFGSSMVLQRDREIKIFGTGEGEGEIEFRGSTVHFSSVNGRFEVTLPPVGAGGPFEMRVTLNGDTQILTDVLVGDVYLAGGQSNMQFMVEESTDIFPEDCEGVRYFTEPHDARAYNEDRPFYNNRGWLHCTSEEAKKFSAIGFGVARELYKKTGIPVGIVDCCLGSSRVDAWTSPDIVNTPEYQALMPEKHEDYYFCKTNRDFWLYENKLLNVAPFVLNGVLWYQGESNRGAGEAFSYGKQLKIMIENWREVFSDPSLTFYVVQLAPFYELPDRKPCDWAAIRAGQEWASKNVPDTYMVTLQHTGEGKLIHPTRKYGLCVALANAVLNSKFGVDVEYSGPIAEKFEEIENGLRITFSHADGLHVRGEYLEDTFIRSRYGDHGDVLFPEIEGNVLTLRYRGAPFDGIRITMGYDNYCHHNLYNSSGYLASPFCYVLEKEKEC